MAGLLLIVNLLTLYALLRVWNEAFWKKTPEHMASHAPPRIYATAAARMLLLRPFGRPGSA